MKSPREWEDLLFAVWLLRQRWENLSVQEQMFLAKIEREIRFYKNIAEQREARV